MRLSRRYFPDLIAQYPVDKPGRSDKVQKTYILNPVQSSFLLRSVPWIRPSQPDSRRGLFNVSARGTFMMFNQVALTAVVITLFTLWAFLR